MNARRVMQRHEARAKSDKVTQYWHCKAVRKCEVHLPRSDSESAALEKQMLWPYSIVLGTQRALEVEEPVITISE